MDRLADSSGSDDADEMMDEESSEGDDIKV